MKQMNSKLSGLFHDQARENGEWMAKGLEHRGWVPKVLGDSSLGD